MGERVHTERGWSFGTAFRFTAFPFVVLSVLSVGGTIGTDPGTYGPERSYGSEAPDLMALYFVWYLAAGVGLLSPLVGVALWAIGWKKARDGVFAGFGLGLLALTATCFANLASAF